MSCASDRSRVASAKKRAELPLRPGVAKPSMGASCIKSSDPVDDLHDSSSPTDRRSKSPSWWEGSVVMVNRDDTQQTMSEEREARS
jgi:hypothetical protein